MGIWRIALCVPLLALTAGVAQQQEKPKERTEKEIAGRAEFLRAIPKKYATLKAVDVAGRKVTIEVDGEKAREWDLTPDAEVKVAGWWGRLNDLTLGDRVWVWLAINRKKEPVAICMIADELTQQNLHDEQGVTVVSREGDKFSIKDEYLKTRELTGDAAALKAGERRYVQTDGKRARLVLTPKEFESARDKQKAVQRERWSKEGLPGTVAFIHVFHGEMDVMLDHEAMRWARALKSGVSVSIQADPPVKATVKEIESRRDRTLLRVIAVNVDLTDFQGGQRVQVICPAPPTETETALFPPGLDDPRDGKEKRIDWFMSNIYCTCGVRGEGCTGHFYTLASCNPNACGMPKRMRRILGEKIDQGKTDRQIMEELHKQEGSNLLRPHVLP